MSIVDPWLYWSLVPIHRLFLSCYFQQILIYGNRHLPTQGPVILAVKHFSRWDPLIVALLSTEPMGFMTNANQFDGVQGWFIQRLGGFPVDVDQPRLSSMRTAITWLQQGRKLVIFPEGGIVKDQPLRSLKTGLARLVLQAEAKQPMIPIVPISIHYQPRDRFRASIALHISPPLFSKDYRHITDKQTALALTHALEQSLLAGLETLTR